MSIIRQSALLNLLGKHLAWVLLICLAACTPPPKRSLRYLFPPPPNTPKAEWIATYASDGDFPKTEAQRNLEKLAGKISNHLLAPTGIASDGAGKVFVGDIQRRNILVFDLNEKSVHYLLSDGSVEPRQMTFDSRQQLYVADSSRHCVLVFSRDGQQLRIYGGPDELQKPLGVAVDETRKRLYVSDGAAHLVKVFDLDSGQALSTIGTGFTSKNDGDIYNPAGLSLDDDGSLCVVEHLNARISIFNPDGTFRKHFGSRDASDSGFENPRAAAFDSEGNLWVVDFRRNALRAYDLEGQLLFAHEGPEKDRTGFSTPVAIHIDANDDIFVADFAAGRFSYWRFLSQKALALHPITDEDLALITDALTPKEEEDVNPTPLK